MNYDLILPQRILFGWGKRSEAGGLAKSLGKQAVLVCGSRTLERNGMLEELRQTLRQSGLGVLETLFISREPLLEDVDRWTDSFRHLQDEQGVFFLAIGGGAAIDFAKALAAMLPQRESRTVRDYLEGVGRGLVLKEDPLPVFAMPTTAGTGSEATKNAVIGSFDPPFKKSLRDPRMIPKIVLIDPELTVSCPAKVTAESGMDAITQLFESYVTRKATPITSLLCEEGLRLGWGAIAEAVENPQSRVAREKMAQAALLSGIALANASLGMAHGIAPALGTHAHVQHGAACALLLGPTLRANAGVCRERYARLSRILLEPQADETDADAIEKLIREIETLCKRIGVARNLSELGVQKEMIPRIAKDSQGNSMQGNPRPLSETEIVRILEEIM